MGRCKNNVTTIVILYRKFVLNIYMYIWVHMHVCEAHMYNNVMYSIYASTTVPILCTHRLLIYNISCSTFWALFLKYVLQYCPRARL